MSSSSNTNISTSSTTNTINSSTFTVNISTSVSNTNTMTNNDSEWNERTIRLLINQRKYWNSEYYLIIGRSRKNYWESIAKRVNRDAGSNFTGQQCKRKFNNLVLRYYVSKLCQYKKMFYY